VPSISSEYVRHRVDKDTSATLALHRPAVALAETASSHPHLDLYPHHSVRRSGRSRRSLSDLGCRAINVTVPLVALILLLPLMLVIAVVVRMSSPGPVIYRQPRVGVDLRSLRDRRRGPHLGGREPAEDGRRRRDRGGRVFQIYKFRTMLERPADVQQSWCAPGDSRITPVGRVLRATRLDELPQLWNVLIGDMNVVGPRPEQPEIFQELRQHIRGYQMRQIVLPGITGWAQVNQAYDQTLDDVAHKIQLDMEYIARRSPVADFAIMARTVPVMLFRRGAL
jgi:lipopolysaccharide/colanic/teichoic acid biosynthesis glycosyltransferase